MNENCCLCKCLTKLYFFYWLLVVSYNFSLFAICFQSFMNITCGRTQNAAHIRHFLRLHIVLTSEFFVLRCNSFNVHCKFSACQKWEAAQLAVWVILGIFLSCSTCTCRPCRPCGIWLPEGQIRATLLDWFLTGSHWFHNDNNFIINCIRPDVWNL